MKKAKFFFKYILTPVFIGLIVSLISAFVLQTFAAPPDSPYRPGATLSPSCSPGDTNCSVSSPLTFDTTNVNVPIGTTTAASLLELYSTSTAAVLTITSATSTTTYDPYLAFRTGATPAVKFILGVDYSDSNKLKFATSTIGTNDILVIDQNGNVGVGTSTPGVLLEVAGTARMTGFQLGTSATTGYILTANSSGVGTWQVAPAGSATTTIQGVTGPTFTFATTTDTNLNLSIATSTGQLTFTPIWIGTLADNRIASAGTWNAMTPSSTQVIAGTGLAGGGALTGNVTLNSTGVLSLGAATGTITLTSPLTMTSGVLSMPTSTASQSGYLSAADWLTFNNKQAQLWGLSGSNLFASSTSWNVGIGTTTPSQTLTVNGGLFVGTSTVGIPTLYVASTTGRVGIGTSTPSSLLDVAGIVQLRGFATSTTGLYVDGSGNVGIGTTGPGRKLDVFYADSVAQLRLSQTGSVYSEFKVDSVGDLTVSATGGDIRLLDENFYVCSGSACPTTGFSISGTGNLVVENKVIADKFEQICPTGYIWVPGAAKFGTLPGFCVMKYEAKNVAGVAASNASTTPWVSISQETSRTTCQAVGTGYHLISEAEWMTIAENIANTTINDMDDDAGLQLATGHTDNAPATAATSTSGADPVVSGCVLTSTMENASNAYAAGTCEIQGDGSYGDDNNDKGYYMTGQNWSATGYSSGLANKSQLRTHILSNGNVIWDMAGSVWEWTDSLIIGQEEPVDDTPAGEWLEYTAITKYNNLPYARPPDDGWSATNGIGRLYTVGTGTSTYAFIRGGRWVSEAYAGVFALNLGDAPADTYTAVGFRCAR